MIFSVSMEEASWKRADIGSGGSVCARDITAQGVGSPVPLSSHCAFVLCLLGIKPDPSGLGHEAGGAAGKGP